MKKRVTQEQRILRHLREYGSITSFDAFLEFNITRLSAIIFNLRKSYNITDRWIQIKNKYNEKILFKEYILEEK